MVNKNNNFSIWAMFSGQGPQIFSKWYFDPQVVTKTQNIF